MGYIEDVFRCQRHRLWCMATYSYLAETLHGIQERYGPAGVSIFVGTLFYLWYLRYGPPGLPESAVLLAMPVAYYLSRYLVSGGHRVVREAPDPLPRVEAGRPPCRQAQARYLVMGGRSVVREAPAQLRRAGRGRRELQQRPPWK